MPRPPPASPARQQGTRTQRPPSQANRHPIPPRAPRVSKGHARNAHRRRPIAIPSPRRAPRVSKGHARNAHRRRPIAIPSPRRAPRVSKGHAPNAHRRKPIAHPIHRRRAPRVSKGKDEDPRRASDGPLGCPSPERRSGIPPRERGSLHPGRRTRSRVGAHRAVRPDEVARLSPRTSQVPSSVAAWRKRPIPSVSSVPIAALMTPTFSAIMLARTVSV